MSISLEINEEKLNLSKEKPLKLHYIPATIEGDGQANVDNYFEEYTTEEDGIFTNSLRGYPLKGCDYNIPTDFSGIVFQETRRPLDESADRIFKMSGTFSKFTYWNYDKIPSKNDSLRQALDFISVAETICEPITQEEVEEEIRNMSSGGIKEESDDLKENGTNKH